MAYTTKDIKSIKTITPAIIPAILSPFFALSCKIIFLTNTRFHYIRILVIIHQSLFRLDVIPIQLSVFSTPVTRAAITVGMIGAKEKGSLLRDPPVLSDQNMNIQLLIFKTA